MHWYMVASQLEARIFIKTTERQRLKVLHTLSTPLGEEAVKQFPREISEYLKDEKLKKSFDTLSVVAEPDFLGKIRAEMSEDLKRTVAEWIKKDLQKTPTEKIVEILL